MQVRSDFQADLRKDLYADIADVVRASQESSGAVQILDVRSVQQFQGTVRRSKHAGRVPGTSSSLARGKPFLKRHS